PWLEVSAAGGTELRGHANRLPPEVVRRGEPGVDRGAMGRPPRAGPPGPPAIAKNGPNSPPPAYGTTSAHPVTSYNRRSGSAPATGTEGVDRPPPNKGRMSKSRRYKEIQLDLDDGGQAGNEHAQFRPE